MKNSYRLFRCTFLKVTEDYIIGKDRNGRRYYIVRNEATEKYKEGGDESFYATLEVKGLLLKKLVLNPIRYETYLELINKYDKNEQRKTS